MSKSVYEFDATIMRGKDGIAVYPTVRKPEDGNPNLLEFCNGGANLFGPLFLKGEQKPVRVKVKVKHVTGRYLNGEGKTIKDNSGHRVRFPVTLIGYMDEGDKYFALEHPRQGGIDLIGRWPLLMGARTLKIDEKNEAHTKATVTITRA